MSEMSNIVDLLEQEQILPSEDFAQLLTTTDLRQIAYLHSRADSVRQKCFGNSVYIRGLIEISNYCKRDCLYCGIRASNSNVARYRLTAEEILTCCVKGYALGFRTFVLQGGEDPFFTDAVLLPLVDTIKNTYPDCAITLSLGERSYGSYKALFDAGADRYLLRHETANAEHFARLHPKESSLEQRKQCLYDLKAIGYQVGCGFMVGSPYQTVDHLVEDLLFIKEINPQMVGIGPFIPHKDTPFAGKKAGTMELTLRILSMVRLLLPHALLPSTTALGTIDPQGREKGICAGANVVMPNLSPVWAREKYMLYNNKLHTGCEEAKYLKTLKKKISCAGYTIVQSRGDYLQDETIH